MIANHPIYGMIRYHVTLSYKETPVPHLVGTLIFLSQNYSNYIRGGRSPLNLYILVYESQEKCKKNINLGIHMYCIHYNYIVTVSCLLGCRFKFHYS